MMQKEKCMDELTQEIAQLKKELADSQERCFLLEKKGRILDAIMDYLPEGITVANAPDVTIQMVSRHGQKLTGKPIHTLVDIPHNEQPTRWDVFHADGVTVPKSEELPLVRATLRGELVTDEEWIIGRPDGSRLTVLCNAGPIYDENGQITGGLVWSCPR